ncbi:hypothetical protein [Carboxydothermus hydrogenoformans]|uniref:hypothetical protein n=1 Tax=Carboxydothermus hydrogenoformans TaxID=129958 RepID=UPI0003128BAC|nr:hypothetical protein [Carboxydothermus hydrogenoformans]
MVIYPAPIYLYCKFLPKETAMAGKNTGLAVSVFFREKQFSQNPLESLLALHQKGLLFKALPELSHLVGLPQNPERHRLCAWGHTLRVLEELPEKDLELIMAALLHDVGKGLPGVRTYKNGYPNGFWPCRAGSGYSPGYFKTLQFPPANY